MVLLVMEGEKTGVKGQEQTGGLGKKEAEKQGCVLRAWVLGNGRANCWIWVILCRMCCPPPVLAGGRGQAGDGGSCHGTANCNQKVVVPAGGGGLQLICILLSLQMEACLVADYTGGYLLAKHCTVLIFPFCLFRL